MRAAVITALACGIAACDPPAPPAGAPPQSPAAAKAEASRPAHPPIPPPPPAAATKPKRATTPPARKRPPPAPPAPAYALDRVSRKVPITGRTRCPPVELVHYSGTALAFHSPLKINKAFVAHVRAFETIVRDTAIEVYGRPPTRIRHMGSYYCRRISTWPYLVSEHGLGNAVDIGGVDFDRLRPGEHPDVPRRFRRAFKVRLSRHWNATGAAEPHRRFLRRLARRIVDEDGLFRVILGPAHPNHQDHLHLDMARFNIVNVF